MDMMDCFAQDCAEWILNEMLEKASCKMEIMPYTISDQWAGRFNEAAFDYEKNIYSGYVEYLSKRIVKVAEKIQWLKLVAFYR